MQCITDESCTFNCLATFSCWNATMICKENQDCVITCDNDYSCSNSTIIGPSLTGGLVLTCTSNKSCSNSSISSISNGYFIISCVAFEACPFTRINGADYNQQNMSIFCMDKSSCYESKINSLWSRGSLRKKN